MPVLTRCDGQALRAAMASAAAWLEKSSAEVNALNVFPVPDGDTGTNMSMTMRSTVAAVAASQERHLGAMAANMSQGALMGARGNSGVILSQIVRGFAQAVKDERYMDGAVLARALQRATKLAYEGVTKPVEGTMLTVIRRAGEAAAVSADAGGELEQVLTAAVEAAREAVADSPRLLKVLRDAGVVDAGGMGLQLLFEGTLRSLRGESSAEIIAAASPKIAEYKGEQTYGYCTEFLVQGVQLSVPAIRDELGKLGDSLIVVGDNDLVRIHVHTFDPGAALSIGTRLGLLRQVKVDNMQLQHETWKEDREADEEPAQIDGIGIVAVAAGDGFRDLFLSFGVEQVVAGGQTMNPSTEDLVSAINACRHHDVIVLPNNSNIVLTAKQAATLVDRPVRIVPSTTLAQGVTAVMALNLDHGLDENVEAMTKAIGLVQTGEITVAVRDATFDEFHIAEGQAIGLLNGRLAAVGSSVEECLWDLLAKMHPEKAEILTAYFGQDVDESAAGEMGDRILERYPNLAVEVRPGGQPHYHYILSVE